MVHEVKTQNQGKYKIFHPLRKGAEKKKKENQEERGNFLNLVKNTSKKICS